MNLSGQDNHLPSLSNHNLFHSTIGKDIELSGQDRLAYTNALTDTNGLINGNGLTDGNGLTVNIFSKNNMKYTQTQRRHRLSQLAAKNKHRIWLHAMLAVIIIILPLSIYMIEFEPQKRIIQIDGEFQDWKDSKITKYLDSDVEPVPNPSTNLIDCRILHQNDILNFYIQTEFDIFGNKFTLNGIGKKIEMYKLNIFIDTDLNSATGFQVENLGADERIELQGQNGIVTKAISFNFDQSKNILDWNGWVKNSNIEVAKGKFRIEGRHYLLPSSFEKQSGNQQIGILIQMMDTKGNCDFTNPILTGEKEWYQLELIDISPDCIIQNKKVIPLLSLNFVPRGKSEYVNQNKILELQAISWQCQFYDYLLDDDIFHELNGLKLFVDQNFNDQIDPMDFQLTNYEMDFSSENGLKFVFSPPLPIRNNDQEHYLLAFDSGANTYDSKILRLNLYPSNIVASAPIIADIPHYSNRELVLYLGEIPKGITIDGIFTDWHNSEELVTDIDLSRVPDSHQDRDIHAVGINIDSEPSKLSCYLSVSGNLLKGTTVPPIFYSEVISLADHSTSTAKNQNKHSADLQSIENRTIVDLLPRELLGIDKISIFIDTDQNINTGYNPTWLSIGAEYLIQVTGRDCVIDSQGLLEYQKNQNNQWSWIKIGDLPAYKDTFQLETQINWVEAGLEPVNNVDIMFFISDWSGKNSDSVSKLSSTSTKYMSTSFPDLFQHAECIMNSVNNSNNGTFSTSLTRAIMIDSEATTYDALMRSNQRKLVRDINGYWYAFWVEQSGYLKAKRSSNITGTDWSSGEIELAGSGGCVINGATDPAYFPSIAIYRPFIINNNELHLIWARKIGSEISLCYSKCINITSDQNFSNPNSWRKANNATGFDVLTDNVNRGTIENYGFASIAVDRFNQSHIVWQYEYTPDNYGINYTVYNNTFGWHKGNSTPLNITPGLGYAYKSPCIDISFNGIIHVAYANKTIGTNNSINYRQCWDISDSMNLSYWGNASQIQNKEDIVLINKSLPSNNMGEPSLVCDSQGNGRVWIVTSETTGDNLYNIWYTVEDFQDTTYWDQNSTITGGTTDKLRYPTIGFDSSGKVYCVWQRGTDPINIYLSYNSSNSWSAPTEVISGNKNIYPQIPKNLSISVNPVSFIYKEDTNSDLMFYSIPEFSNFAQFILLILIFQIVAITLNKRKWFRISN